MESETISKNGRSLKSQMSKVNIFKFVLTFFVVASLGMGLSGCGQATAQSGGSGSSSSKIPDGTYTYVGVSSYYNASLTFSGSKLTRTSGSTNTQELTYIVKNGDIIMYDSGSSATISRYFLDGGNLILFENFYNNAGNSGDLALRGTVYTKQ